LKRIFIVYLGKMKVGIQKTRNIFKTWLLIGLFLGLIIGIGFLLSVSYNQPNILYIAVGISLVINFASYWFSSSLALAMSGARPVTKEQEPRLHAIVKNLSEKAGLPIPKIYKIEGEEQINAFATGRNPKNAAVAVTTGGLKKLDDSELEGVLAHELSHIQNRDILVSTIIVVLAATISVASRTFLYGSLFGDRNRESSQGGIGIMIIALAVAVVAPFVALIIRMTISRGREYLADASGARLVGNAEGLAKALEKIREDSHQMNHASTATSHLFISNPFRGMEEGSWFIKLFMTHPPLRDRINTLRKLEI
jgi:heat shock protein HtpX